VAAQPLAEQAVPDPATIAQLSERPLLRDVADAMAQFRADEEAALPVLDRLLAKLPRPTPLRGFVQFLRARGLYQTDRLVATQDALEESIRLLPQHSAPLILASRFEAYRDRSEPSVTYLLRAMDIDPKSVARIEDYELGNILGRIPQDRGSALRQRLVQRLFDIGWRGEGPSLRSGLARELIEAHVKSGDLPRARALLPQLVDPTDARLLLTQVRYQALWPQIEEWAGPMQSRLWAVYLEELRASWRASRHYDRAGDYLGALAAADRHKPIVDEFLPLFRDLDAFDDYDLLWMAPRVAASLAQLGRWNDLEALFTSTMNVWPPGSDANALNLIANRGRYRYFRGDHEAAVVDLRAAIRDAGRRGGEVSAHALAPMHHYLACALHRLGRGEEALQSVEYVLNIGSAWSSALLHLCLDQVDEARDALLAGLTVETQRDDVITFMQPDNAAPLPTPVARRLAELRAKLKQDPRLLAALAEHGRILPYRAADGAALAKAP
jgi:tetratricopeptide (TPR) repeat protein